MDIIKSLEKFAFDFGMETEDSDIKAKNVTKKTATYGIGEYGNSDWQYEIAITYGNTENFLHVKTFGNGEATVIGRGIFEEAKGISFMIALNHLPRFAPGVIDQALINRLQFLKVKAPPKALEDKELADKLYDERDYFLTMAILGYAELQKNNYQFDSSKKDEQLEKTVLGIDPAIAFRNDCCIINDKGFMPSADFKAALKIWQKDSLDTSKIKDFKNSLQNLGYRFGKNGKKDYRNTYGFFGLELNETYRKAITRTFKEVENNGKPDKH